MPKRIATWNPKTQLWETDQADLFSEQQEPFSETWPTSGMTRNGQLLPLPMSAHHTAESAYSYLPTPRSSRGSSTTETAYALGGKRSDDNRTQGEVLLPTPRATDGTKGGPNQRGSSGDLMLPSAVMDM